MAGGRIRTGAVAGVVTTGVFLALGASNCASATQIIVDVETEQSLCDSIVVGIAVGKPEEIDTKPFQVRQQECIQGGVQVGTLTITPSGERDATVGVRIVAGVNGTQPEDCGRRSDATGEVSWQNCILARRTVQFAPGQTTPLTVVLSADCIGQVCPDGNECNLGKCVAPTQVQPDGGNQVVKDGQAPYVDAASDTVVIPDATIEAAPDACVYCKGPAGAADCNGTTNTCNVDCRDTNCKDDVVCAGGLNCTINCPTGGDCDKTRCETSGSCSFTCAGPGGQHCTNVSCRATQCAVSCDGADTTCNGVSLEAGSSTMTCAVAPGNRPTCDDVSCSGTICARSCSAGGLGCGPQSSCTGDCSQWQDAGDGG